MELFWGLMNCCHLACPDWHTSALACDSLRTFHTWPGRIEMQHGLVVAVDDAAAFDVLWCLEALLVEPLHPPVMTEGYARCSRVVGCWSLRL